MTAAELHWFVGLFEGEGCVTVDKRPGRRPRLTVVMTDLDVVETILRRVGVGKIYAATVKRGCKPAWAWRTSADEAPRVAAMILPYMGIRRAARIREVFGL